MRWPAVPGLATPSAPATPPPLPGTAPCRKRSGRRVRAHVLGALRAAAAAAGVKASA
ncbi:MAG: hypothetical protein U1F43_10470 [Myxococcota bacterium]